MKIERQIHPVEFYKECSDYIKEGHSMKECAEKFNVNYCTLKQNLTKLGFRKPSRVGKINKEITFDEHYFDTIDSDKKAYFLGFLMSDGYICKTPYSYACGIALQTCDRYILEELKKEVKATVKITEYKNSVKLVLNGSEHLYNTLQQYGICEDKSHSDYIIPSIPSEYFNAFVRGYFDGDGCITIKSTGYSVTSICCNTEVFLQSLQDELTTYGITDTRLHCEMSKSRKNPLYVLYISRRENQKAFKEFIYKNETIKLLRKYEKFEKIPC